jgi:hypothetical protein
VISYPPLGGGPPPVVTATVTTTTTTTTITIGIHKVGLCSAGLEFRRCLVQMPSNRTHTVLSEAFYFYPPPPPKTGNGVGSVEKYHT